MVDLVPPERGDFLKISFLDKTGKAYLIEDIQYLEDDDEIVKMLIDKKPKAIHKSDMFERTYSVVE